MSYGLIQSGRQIKSEAMQGLSDVSRLSTQRDATNRGLRDAQKAQEVNSMATGATTGAVIGSKFGGAAGAAAGTATAAGGAAAGGAVAAGGAASGAAAGAQAGSIIPGAGTLIGAGIGLLAGYFLS